MAVTPAVHLVVEQSPPGDKHVRHCCAPLWPNNATAVTSSVATHINTVRAVLQWLSHAQAQYEPGCDSLGATTAEYRRRAGSILRSAGVEGSVFYIVFTSCTRGRRARARASTRTRRSCPCQEGAYSIVIFIVLMY